MHSFCCQAIYSTFLSWTINIPIGFNYDLYVPQNLTGRGVEKLLVNNFHAISSYLEQYSGVKITEQDFSRTFSIYDENHSLLRQLYEYRKRGVGCLSGAEALIAVLSSVLMDKAEHNALLKEALADVDQRTDSPAGARLMMVSSEFHDVELVKFIESLGSTIVIEDNCMASPLWAKIDSERDPMIALVRRLTSRPPCAVKDLGEMRKRQTHIIDLFREYRAQGILSVLQHYCEPYNFDTPFLKKLCDENSIPFYQIEVDQGLALGPLRTRIEAFIEGISLSV